MPLNIKELLKLAEEMPAFNRLMDELVEKDTNPGVVVLDAAKPFFTAALYHRLMNIPVLLVTSQPENSKKLYEQLVTWSGSDRIMMYPELDSLYFERITSDNSSEIERLKVLSSLNGIDSEEESVNELSPLVVTSAMALMQKVPPKDDFASACRMISVGMEIEPLRLVGMCLDTGYRLEDTVEVPGAVSRRGGIIDIYPPTSERPVRLEFFGNTIDSIRFFDPTTQRSSISVSSVLITPATEIFTPFMYDKTGLEEIIDGVDISGCTPELREYLNKDMRMLLDKQKTDDLQLYAPLFNRDSILSYLSGNMLLVIDELQSIKSIVEDLEAKSEELRNEKITQGELPPRFPRPYLVWEELEPLINKQRRITFSILGLTDDKQYYNLDFTPAPKYAGQITTFIKKTGEMLRENKRIILISHQASRLSELLAEEDIIATPVTEINRLPPNGSVTLVQGIMSEGWTMMGDTYLLTDAELFGFIKQRRLLKKQAAPQQRIGVDIKIGDYVVHVEHGIARFAGVTRLAAEGGDKEYLVLLYDSGDRLYVPTDQIDRVSRYIGAGERTPVLSRLGTQEWTRNKQRVKEAVADIAEELLSLYAAREVAPGFRFSPDTIWQREVEASFPYVETPDQIEVQKQIKEDMEKSKPMDRLVCGDVGYGKTEVAIRAAFKAVMDGKQVAVLVPTTVLAEQHYSTFSQRLAAFPIKIEVLSRFRSNKEQKVILEGISNGSVDICIGTHRLIQKDVIFKELGLLIIDEEQRFGVVHKEYFKKKRQEVDVLTLSATPIPRTLHMSLVGVRDMSVMETPPEERLPVKTYVAEYNERLVRDAVIREIERNGQVFFVHNRVQSIGYMAGKLQALIPEARITIGHGQMHEVELEKTMTDFINGNSDVLVCSSIIQSGLDMPNVNTLIINQADKFGLTQLYQLRGRVGRGANLAYAYFLYDKGKRLTPVAELRLRTIFEANELGAGFNIAMKDLEIRGAGTLLGVRQSGHISTVGFNLYCQLLAQAVEEQKAKKAGIAVEVSSLLPSPTIALPFPAYIPEYYVSDLDTRLALYNKLVKLDKIEQIESMQQEFEDRFGAPPLEVENLLYAVKIRMLAAVAGIASVSTEQGEIVLRLFEGMRFGKQKVDKILKDGIKFHPFHLRLNKRRLGKNWQQVLEEVLQSII